MNVLPFPSREELAPELAFSFRGKNFSASYDEVYELALKLAGLIHAYDWNQGDRADGCTCDDDLST